MEGNQRKTGTECLNEMPICHSDSLNYINVLAKISLQVMITFVSGQSWFTVDFEVPGQPQIWKTEQSYLWNGNTILLLTWHRSEQ